MFLGAGEAGALLITLAVLAQPVIILAQAVDFSTVLGETSTARLFRTRGYIARDYYVKVQNGEYTLNVVRVTNPLINDGLAGLPHLEPLFLVHGAAQNANSFAYINDKVRPHNYSGHDINSLSLGRLSRLVRGDQGAQSIAFTALNFGYEIWLLNRRQTYESRRAQGYGVPFDTKDIDDNHGSTDRDLSKESHKSLDFIGNLQDLLSGQLSTGIQGAIGPYWNFSLDPQAQHDIPETISFVLAKTKKPKLIYVGISEGTTILLMSLIDYPDLAEKISKVILWAPVFDLPNGVLERKLSSVAARLAPVLAKIQAPIISQDECTALNVYIGTMCGIALLMPLCSAFLDAEYGLGTQQSRPEYLNFENRYRQPASFMEIAQFLQAVQKTTMHRFDFEDRAANLRAYGQLEPPEYDISRIRHRRISVWLGNTDILGQIGNFNFTKQRMTVSINEHIIDGNGVQWNHIAPLIHKDNANLIILPTLMKMAAP